MASKLAENVVVNVVVMAGTALVIGYLFGYAFTHGSHAAGCLQGTCNTPSLSSNIL